jgi:topoisomerase-4 subunit A
MIEKYNPEKVYTVVHYEGKSKNYMVKRFVFENTVIGKQTGFISDENGSKLILISGAAQPVAMVEQLKGKTQVPETVEMNLADLIDVKGMKAMGNRLSAHAVQSIQLIAEHDDEEDVPDPAPETVEASEIVITPEDKTTVDIAPAPNIAPVASAESTAEPIDEPVQPEEPPVKKVDFEITNPDDIEIDDKGQLGLF